MTWFSPGRLSSLILQTNLELTVITTVAFVVELPLGVWNCPLAYWTMAANISEAIPQLATVPQCIVS